MKRLFPNEKVANSFAAACTAVIGGTTAYHYYVTRYRLSPESSGLLSGKDYGVKIVRFYLDPERTKLNFTTGHGLHGTGNILVHGQFKEFRGNLEVAVKGGKQLDVKLVDVEVLTKSFDTNNWLRDWRVRVVLAREVNNSGSISPCGFPDNQGIRGACFDSLVYFRHHHLTTRTRDSRPFSPKILSKKFSPSPPHRRKNVGKPFLFKEFVRKGGGTKRPKDLKSVFPGSAPGSPFSVGSFQAPDSAEPTPP